MNSLSSDELTRWIAYVKTISGIALDTSKAYLIESRLNALALETGCMSWSDLLLKAKTDTSMHLQRKIIDAITTGETSFFRDSAPFDLLQNKILPDLIDIRKKMNAQKAKVQIKIWSAACSTGQEVYSIAIVLRELLGNIDGYDLSVLGTDISGKAISTASCGKYSRFEIERGMPAAKVDRYFNKLGDYLQIKEEIRSMVTFKNINLFEPLPFSQKFDIIFCRNVAIYFTMDDRKKLYEKLLLQLNPDGYLIIGSTESLLGLCPQLEAHRYLRSVYYQTKKV